MKTTFTKKLAVLVLSAVMVFGLGFGIANLNNANAASEKIEIAGLQEKYALNSNLKLEDRVYNVTFGSDTNLVIQEGTITYPNGFIYQANNSVGHKLDQIGQYTVAYKLVTNLGKTITVYDTFDVKSEYFYLSTDNGSTVTSSSVQPLGSKLDGISTVLNDGCELVFNKPIDLNKEGLVDVISFDPEGYDHELLATTGGWNSYADFVTVTLTDAYDASIYVYYRLCVRTQSGYGYIRCGTNSQQDGGLQETENPEGRWDRIAVYINGQGYLNYFTETLGTQSKGGAKNNTLYNLKYDFKNNYAYVDCGAGNRLIAQLQNPACYNAGVKMFQGFTTGEVFVSIKAENYTTPGYQIDITSVGDMSGTELISNYNDGKWEENYKDERAPSIYYDLKKTTSTGVYVALGEDFTIPASTVYDVNLATDISVNVYKDYKDPQQKTPVTIRDGKFKVEDFETYTVEYSASDYAGNVGYATFEVIPVNLSGLNSNKALNNIGTIIFETDKLSKIYSGNTVVLPEYSVMTHNLSDELSVKIVATCNGKTYEIDPELREFIPQTTGTYQISYILQDNAVTKVLSYEIECESNGIVRFMGKPNVLRDYLAGFTYEIEPVYAYKYVDSSTKVNTKAEVEYDESGVWTEIVDLNNFVVSNTANKLRFRFTALEASAGGEAPVVYTDFATIRNVGFGDKLSPVDYFYGDFTGSYASTNIVFDNIGEGTKKLSFVNPIAFANFTIEFNTNVPRSTATGNIQRINVIFTDIYDATKKAVFSVYQSNGSLYFTTDKSTNSTMVAGTMLGTGVKSFNYDHLLRKAKFGSTVMDYYTEFTTELAYVDIELVGVTGEVRLNPKKVANVNFNKNLTVDKKESTWFVQRDHGNKAINSVATIYAPSVADVLTPSLYYNGYVTHAVKDADGNFAVGYDDEGNSVVLDGVHNDPKKDYKINLNQYTTYTATLTITDVSAQNTGASTRTRNETYRIYVVNDRAPVITLGNGLSSETVMNVELGKEFSIPYTVTDDNTEPEDLVVSVIIYSKKGGYCVYTAKPFNVILEEGGKTEYITDKCSINRKGEYYVYVYSYDTSGNFASAYFTINVI